MMVQIEAGERLAAINDAAVATGNVEQHVTRRMIGRLERAARGSPGKRAAVPQPQTLAGMGIGVRMVAAPSEKARNPVSGTGQADG